MRRSHLTALCLAASLTLSVLAGCSEKTLELGHSKEKLDTLIADSGNKPLVVDFWKFGCASCMSLEPVIAKLADEYDGRVAVARYQMEYLWFQPTNWEVFKRYGFAFFPTVILFVDGKEQHRWVWNLDKDAYRKVLDSVLATRAGGVPATAPAKPAGKG